MEVDEGVLRKGEFSEIVNSIVDKLHQKNDGVKPVRVLIQSSTLLGNNGVSDD